MMAQPHKKAEARNAAIDSALKAVATETAGLSALTTALDGALGTALGEAVHLIGEAKGRVIVTGMGKSGHIGAKISATLASTGTPAFFVHPAEAGHGDLGMIRPEDVILALSWSGETAELKSIVYYSRRFAVPLIAITSGAGSTLAEAADITMVLPPVEEACPLDLAPTTTALVQLALGDALAIALLESRGFSAADFHAFHPGGSLGANLTHIRDIMHTGDKVPLAPLGTPMSEASVLMTRKGFGCLGITDAKDHLVGIVTDGDLRRNLGKDLLERSVDEVMTPGPRSIAPDELVASAIETLNAASITALFVVEDKRPVGIVHMHDLLRIGAA
jgi:arabinose-5-phosphate isomerase